MENATTALVMAGGILIAIIVISLFILGYSNVTMLAQSKLDAELAEEINEFNKPLLAFNKKAMYGTDVISILNLAISNNKINNVKPGQELYIDVSFKLTKDAIQDTVYEYTLNSQNATYSSSIIKKDKASYGASDFTFEINRTYSLSSNLEPITAFLKTASNGEETKRIVSTEGAIATRYTITYSGIADFKRKTFKCSSVGYDSNGRINLLKFEQIKESVYEGERN